MGKSTRNTKNIVPPAFADTVYDVTDYGAKSDTTFDSRPAILQAISHCNTNGGGTVLIPTGNYFIKGAITLKSNINLHRRRSTSGILYQSRWLPAYGTDKMGRNRMFQLLPFIYAYQCTNVAVTGKGTIDGNGSVTFNGWHAIQRSCRRPSAPDGCRFRSCIPTRIRRRTLSASQHDTILRLQERIGRRFKIYDSPFWIIHPVFCDNVTTAPECIYRQQQLQ